MRKSLFPFLQKKISQMFDPVLLFKMVSEVVFFKLFVICKLFMLVIQLAELQKCKLLYLNYCSFLNVFTRCKGAKWLVLQGEKQAKKKEMPEQQRKTNEEIQSLLVKAKKHFQIVTKQLTRKNRRGEMRGQRAFNWWNQLFIKRSNKLLQLIAFSQPWS